jgi:hypothetical protein
MVNQGMFEHPALDLDVYFYNRDQGQGFEVSSPLQLPVLSFWNAKYYVFEVAM